MRDDGEPPGPGFGAREHACPACGAVAVTAFARCPACGARYGASPRRGRRRRRVAATLAAAAVLAAAVVAVLVALGAKADRDARARAAQRAAVAREVARLRRVQAPRRGGAPALRAAPGATPAARLRARRRLVLAAQRAITADARRRARAGEIAGPVRRTECGPVLRAPDAVPDDRVAGRPIGRYDCVAVRRDVRGAGGSRVAALGYAYVVALDFRRATWTFCANTPPQGERGEALAQVRLDRACLAARGRALDTGYVDTGPRP